MTRDERAWDDRAEEAPRRWQRRHLERFLVSRAEAQRLDVPQLPNRPLVRLEYDPELFGRFSERFARFLGTAQFLAWMTAFVLAYIGWNVLAPVSVRFDPYPFIFLTLMLSLQASYAAPLILLAQNRQEARDRVALEQDRAAAARAHADMEFLAREVATLRHGLGEVPTRDFLRSELRDLLSELEERSDGPSEGPGAFRTSPT